MTWAAARAAITAAMVATTPTAKAPGYPACFNSVSSPLGQRERGVFVVATGMASLRQGRTVTPARLVVHYSGNRPDVAAVAVQDGEDLAGALAGVGNATVSAVLGSGKGGALVPKVSPNASGELALTIDMSVEHV